MRRRWKWLLAGTALLIVGGAAVFIHDDPAAGAYICPSCYGFQKSGGDLYTEADMAGAEIATFRATRTEAMSRVQSFYGKLGPNPVLFVCGSDACDTRMKYRGAKARAYGSAFVLVYSKGRTAEFLSHERSHIELAHRIGDWRGFRNAIPAWFNEGLASVISLDSRYVAVAPDGMQSCTAEPDGPLPETLAEWGRAAGDRTRPIYAMAACRTLRWMQKNGGKDGALAMIGRVAEGHSFE